MDSDLLQYYRGGKRVAWDPNFVFVIKGRPLVHFKCAKETWRYDFPHPLKQRSANCWQRNQKEMSRISSHQRFPAISNLKESARQRDWRPGVDEWKMSVEAGNGRCVGEVMEGRLCWRHILSPPAKVEITPGWWRPTTGKNKRRWNALKRVKTGQRKATPQTSWSLR